jgi:hypothetical protein
MGSPPAPRVPTIALALPWLDDARQGEDPGLSPELAWLLERSSSVPVENLDWRAWLLGHVTGGFEVMRRHPPGPTRQILARELARASTSKAPANHDQHAAATWACARPVHFATGIDHLSLEPSLALPLSPQETEEVIRSLNEGLIDRGWWIIALDVDRWLLGCGRSIECESSAPTDAVGRELRSRLPEGRDARQVRTVMNEMQMTLHTHAVNERRVERGVQPVNAVWLWGFGPGREVESVQLPRLASDDEYLEELWRIHSQPVVATTAPIDFAAESDYLVAFSSPGMADAQRTGTAIFAPLKAVLEARGPRAVELFSGRAVYRYDSAVARSVVSRWWSRVRGNR